MPVIATAASAGIKAGTGLWQMYQGFKARQMERPEYEIPQSIKDKMTTAEMLQFQGLPASQKQEYIDNLSRNMAFSFGELDDRKAGIAGTATLNQQANDAAKGLLSADSAVRMDNINKLQETRSEVGGYQDKEFTFNKANPYYEKMNQANADLGAGMQNVVGAVDQGAVALGNQSTKTNNTAQPPTTFDYSQYAKKNPGTPVDNLNFG